MNWRDLAQKCGVNITSRFDYPKNGSISVDNKVYTFTMNKCTFRRITTPPMSDQEKCLVILSLWVKSLQNTHQVTSLIPLLKRKNINYLTGYISYFYILLPFLYYVFILGGERGTSGAGCNLKFNIIIPGQLQWNYYLSMNLHILYVINLFQKDIYPLL